MISMRNISLRSKLVVMQVFTSVLVLGLCFWAFVFYDIRGYKNRKVNSTISIAQAIGSNSVSALQFVDNDAANKILFELQKIEPDVINASIYDEKGKEFANYTKTGRVNQIFAAPYRDTSWFDDKYLYVYQKIASGKDRLGTVCLQVELTQLEEIRAEILQIASVLLIVGLALAFILALINQRYISIPLLNLIKEMQQIRESNDYSRPVYVEGKDEISRLSDEFNSLMKQVAKSNQKKDEFIGIASHELKTPLTSVKLYLQTLARMKHDPVTSTFVLKARDGVDKLQNLIMDLLDVSKIEAGQLQLNNKAIDLDSLVDECILNAQMNTQSHTIKRVGKMTAITLVADRDRLEQVLNNFVSNAIKYSPGEKDILVSTIENEGSIEVMVTDFGIGIPKSEHKKVFERFYRSGENESVVSGFGLGLYICSQIIKRHKGTIGVKSEKGKGSTFYFTLPVN